MTTSLTYCRLSWVKAMLCCLFWLFSTTAVSQPESGRRLDFVENKGQWPQQALFRSTASHSTLFLEADGFTLVLSSPYDSTEMTDYDRRFVSAHHDAHHMGPYHYHACRIRFVGASPNTVLTGLGLADSYENYFIGSDSSHWASRCRLFGTVEYRDLYPGIDMRVYSAEQAFKYEFIVSPGSSPNAIAMAFDSISSIRLADSNLVVTTTAGGWTEYRPYVYQDTEKGRNRIPASFRLSDSLVTIDIGSYDTTLPLIVDPYLVFSTYTGSTADNWGTTAAFDSYKNVYTAGLVFGNGYPSSLGAYDQAYNGNADIGIFKFDSSGSQRIYATYLGGSNADMPHSMYVNSLDELVVMGTTGSPNFPISANAYQRTFLGGTEIGYLNSYSMHFPTGSDLFISRFSSDGSQLQASTFLGGTQNDGLNYRQYYNRSITTVMQGNDSLYYNYGDGARGEIITDDLNNIYIGTTTFSFDFFPYGHRRIQRENHGRQEGIVAKLDYNLSNMIWGTYFGGGGDDAIYSIDVDDQYNLLICGGTNSRDFPTTPQSYHPTAFGGAADGFVAKISYNGERLMASTYFGSTSYDQAYFVRSGRHNEVFLFGQTCAPGSTLIANANYNVPNSGQFLARLTPTLSQIEWSTTFGNGNGLPNISPTAFGADICNRVYAVGWGRNFVGYNGVDWNTSGTTNLEVTPDAYQSTTDGQDFYIISLSGDAGQLEYATFFGELHSNANPGGSDHVDGGTSRFDKLGTLYQAVCASCGSTNGFPTTPGAWSTTNQSHNCNNALFRFNINDDFAVAEFVQPPAGCAPYDVSFHNTGRGAAFTWDFGDGSTSTEANPTHQYSTPGSYTVTLIATLPDGCVDADTATHTIFVVGLDNHHLEPILSCNGSSQQIGLKPMVGCTYQWIQGSVSDSTIANPWVYSDGDYILQVTAEAGCSEVDTFSVAFINLIDTILVIPASCPNSCDAQVIAITNSDQAVGSILYNWDGASLPDSILFDQCPTDQIRLLTATDGRCSDTASYRITGPTPMVIQKEASTILCSDSCSGSIHLWTDQQVDTTLNHLCEGEYVLSVFDTIGCQYDDTTLIIADHILDAFDAWADDTLIYLTESTTLHAVPIPNATYRWEPSISVEHPYKANTSATPDDTLTIYQVTVTDSLGCQTSKDITIRCIVVNCGEGNIFIPNAFTPNDDGINDQFCVTGELIVSYHMRIFTRWGELIYDSEDISQCWDGRYKDNWCMPGVYTYVCQITCEAGIETLFKGNITLIR